MILVDGDAVTEEPVVELRPVDGDHEYVDAPLAVSMVEPPVQILVEGLTVMVGIGFTVTVTVFCAVQPDPSVPTTVYVVVVVGDAVTVAPVVPLNPVAGDHT